MSAREYSHVINIFLVLIPVRIEVKCSRIRHVAPSIVGDDSDVIAYLVLIRIAFERIKRVANRHIGSPSDAGVSAIGIEKLRVRVVRGVSGVMPNRIQATIGRYSKGSEPVPLARVNRVVINLVRRTEG